jgi:Leucine-rich repeat (LRR) protein
MKLTPAVIADLNEGTLIQDLKELKLSNLQINHIDDISVCISLSKLDLSENALESANSLSGLHYMKGLTMLNLSKNSLKDVDHLKELKKLFVLNVSYNQLREVPLVVWRLENLKALVLNNNQIGTLTKDLKFPLSISTIILSDNLIEDMDFFASKSFPSLTKISLSHNQIRIIPIGLAKKMPQLKEIRLSGNKITCIPTGALPHSLEILDLSNNLIGDLADLEGLKQLSRLKNLSIKGCPIGKEQREKIREMLPQLRIIDGERFDERWFLKRKQKTENFKAKRRVEAIQ